MMTVKLKHFSIHLLFFCWGIVSLYWGIFGDFERLLNPFFKPGVIAAGIVFILLTVFKSDLDSFERCSHTESFSWGYWWLGMIGMGFVLFCRPDGLSMKTILNRDLGSQNTDFSGRESPLTAKVLNEKPSERMELDLLDLFYVARDSKLREEILGQKISVIGQIVSKKGFSLMRIMMWCCASDARPIMVEIRDLEGRSWIEGEWIELEATVTFEALGDSMIPILHFIKSKPTPAPEDLYLY